LLTGISNKHDPCHECGLLLGKSSAEALSSPAVEGGSWGGQIIGANRIARRKGINLVLGTDIARAFEVPVDYRSQ
jgi:hypothetical protein